MLILLHGGKCCGIKHIHGLTNNPLQITSAKRETNPYQHEGTCYTRGKNENFFSPAAPKETLKDRFVRYVDYLRQVRPQGVVEVVLSQYQLKWVPILEELGFKKVTRAKNSNSRGTIIIYHLVTGV